MDYETIRYEVDDGVLTLTLNRPDRLNAFNREMLLELIDAIGRSDADDEIRAVIVTGAGRGFCAGADLSPGANTFDRGGGSAESNRSEADQLERMRDGGGLLTLRLFESRKPLIAAINGPAVGIGITMTLPMDVRIASTAARIGFVFARRGLVPEACSSWFLPRVVGVSKALEWTFSGRVFDADEALAGGLLRSVHEPDDLLDVARTVAREMTESSSAVSIAMTRHMIWKMLGADHPMEAHKVDSRAIRALGREADVREGVASFLEKRDANFTMSVDTDMPEFFPWWEERHFS